MMNLGSSRHVVVTRFAVPRAESDTDGLYCKPDWLAERMSLFRRFYVPSVARLNVPAVLLCGSKAADWVASEVAALPWAKVVVQDDWHGGWVGGADQVLTRLDSDDAVHRDWLKTVDASPRDASILITKSFLRFDLKARRLHRYRRKEPSPLAAFRGGVNPYEIDHKYLERDKQGVYALAPPLLLQVVHGGNIANRRPSPWRIDRRVSMSTLSHFGLSF